MITTLLPLLSEISTEISKTTILVGGQIVIAIITGYCLIKVAQLKSHINSRMDELLKLTSEAGFAKGKIEGNIEGNIEGKIEGRKEKVAEEKVRSSRTTL